MVKVCARPACGAEATARFFFDAAGKLVILDARIAEWGGSGVLCDDHADKLTPPRGWMIDDRRVLAPRLFPVGRFESGERPASAADTTVAEPTVANIRSGPPPSRARRFAAPAAHPSTPLPLDGGPSYALPDEYLARDAAIELPIAETAPERLTDTAEPGTPLLSRAFDAARSKVRPTSTLDTLIPHAN